MSFSQLQAVKGPQLPFQYLLVTVAAIESFAHGSNDTANATGAFGALFQSYEEGMTGVKLVVMMMMAMKQRKYKAEPWNHLVNRVRLTGWLRLAKQATPAQSIALPGG